MIHISNQQTDLKLSTRSVRAFVQAVLEHENISYEEISIYFVTQKRMCDLHQQFFNDPSPTDCISFPIDDKILGDIFVCPKTAIDYAARIKKDPYPETALYIIHGILHLLGFDDLEAPKRRIMRKKEKQCMAHSKALVKLFRPR